MKLSWIEVNLLKVRSARAASTSAAKKAEVTLQEILGRAGWSSAKTFGTFYNKISNFVYNKFTC